MISSCFGLFRTKSLGQTFDHSNLEICFAIACIETNSVSDIELIIAQTMIWIIQYV